MRNGKAEELICTTHGYELRGKGTLEERGAGWRGIKGKKWDNHNSVINKIYLKIKNKIKI